MKLIPGFVRRWFAGRRAAARALEIADRERARRLELQARYDAAQTGPENQSHWAAADALSANAANSADVRWKLRNRARYEYANNGYCKGLVNGRADAVVGVCPRLQLSLPESEQAAGATVGGDEAPNTDPARVVEQRWQEWVDSVGLADKLRQLMRAELRDGEGFAVARTNPALVERGSPVQLDLALIDAERVADSQTLRTGTIDPLYVDGIKFDRYGCPLSYDILDEHPGDTRGASVLSGGTYTTYTADRVFHLFDPERPGQARGIPGVTAALPLFAQLRRYTLATLSSAEHAASIAGVIENDTIPYPGEDDPTDAADFEQIPFPRGTLLTMPAGHKAKAFDPTQPTTTYGDFKGEILTEAGRAIGAPRNVARGSSADYNYSSGRLDHLPEQAIIKIVRDRIRRVLLERVFRLWYAEAWAVADYLPDGVPADASGWVRVWRWQGFPSIDPGKDASAAEVRLRSGVSDYETECAELGEDWEEVFARRAQQQRLAEQLGITMPGLTPAAVQPATGNANRPAPTESEDELDEGEPIEEEETDGDE